MPSALAIWVGGVSPRCRRACAAARVSGFMTVAPTDAAVSISRRQVLRVARRSRRPDSLDSTWLYEFVGEKRCVAYRCLQEPARERRLCREHQRRLDRGGGLPTASELLSGDPSGRGVFGYVDRDDVGVLCHECGHRFARLGVHLHRTHQLQVALYRRRHGIRASESLAMPPLPDGSPRRKPHTCNRCATVLTTPDKLCVNCRQQRRMDLEERREHTAKPPTRERWRTLTNDECAELLAADPGELPRRVRELQQDRVPSYAIGEVLGRNPAWMSLHHARLGWGKKP